nr:DUF4097 family beta strand repeat-containing protein [Amycolatopsis nigrescens]
MTETPDTAEPSGTENELVRSESFPVEGPVELDLGITLGKIDIRLTERTEAVVELRHDASEQVPWAEGVTNLLSWVSDRFGADLRGSATDAVQQSRIEKTGARIVVRAPDALPLHKIPLAVRVYAPSGSQLKVRAGAAEVTSTGTAGRADVVSGSGDVALDKVDGPASVRTGSGDIRVGGALAGLQVKTGGGNVEASELTGSGSMVTGTGDVWLGAVSGDVMVRSGSGDVAIADASSGTLELQTGSGEIRVGVHSGVAAEITLSSSAGRVSSELEMADQKPEGEVPLRVQARTGLGNAVVTRSAL